jgi:hypothetical protein
VRPADGSRLFILGDEGVFYSHTRQELLSFNTTASFVWCCLEEGLSPGAIAGRYAAAFDVSAQQAQREVAALLDDWREQGYVASADPGPDARPTRAPVAPQGLTASPTGPSTGPITRHYALVTARFAVRFQSEEQAARVHPVIAHLEAPPGAPDAMFAVTRDQSGCVVSEDGVAVEDGVGLDELAPVLKDRIRRLAINRHRYLMQLHAGAVSNGKACILIPGAPGSGKTTLCAGLIRAGFLYFSDEVSLLEGDDLAVRPVPLSLTVKPGAVSALSKLYPGVEQLPTHLREDGQVVRYLNPPPESLPLDPSATAPVGWIVFPRFCPQERTTLRPLPKPEALRRLLGECLSLPQPLDERKVAGLIGWMRRVQCLELRMSSLRRAVELVQSVAGATLRVRVADPPPVSPS